MLVPFDGRQFYRAMSCALEAKRAGALDEGKLAASDARLRGQGGREDVRGVASR